MNWQDEGLVLGVRAHGETAAVAELFTRAHGRHLGLVHGGRSRRLRPVLQTGNHVDAGWRARLDDQLGSYTLELRRGYAAEAMESPTALLGLSSLAQLTRVLPERDPHPSLFEVSLFVLSQLGEERIWPALLARWELALLDELGFGLDLSSCAATGVTTDLIYVSPRSGRAVSAAAGERYKDKLLPLPGFLRGNVPAGPAGAEALQAFALTGYFLEARVLGPRGEGLPEVRSRLLQRLAQAAHSG